MSIKWAYVAERGVNSESEVEKRGRQMTARSRRVHIKEATQRLAKQDVESERGASRLTGDMRGKKSKTTRMLY